MPQTIPQDYDNRDLPSDRMIENPAGNNIHVRSDGIFGHWTIHFEHGEIPSELKGKFTRFIYAEEKVLKYLDNVQKKLNKVKKVRLPGPRDK